MIKENLKKVTDELLTQGVSLATVKNYLKEYLQLYILEFIYNNKEYQKMIFTGGTCLRLCYGLNRLSEDLDFDLEEEIDKERLVLEFKDYFKKKLGYGEMEASIKGQGKKIYLKFPILYDLGISQKGESDKLYVKVEIEKVSLKLAQFEKTPIIKDQFSFFVNHYDLSSLMAGKINAILFRLYVAGKENEVTFKGRDYYDLFWYLQRKVVPNFSMIKKEEGIDIKNVEELFIALDKKIEKINTTHLKQDIINLFPDRKFIEDFSSNFKSLYERYKKEYLAK